MQGGDGLIVPTFTRLARLSEKPHAGCRSIIVPTFAQPTRPSEEVGTIRPCPPCNAPHGRYPSNQTLHLPGTALIQSAAVALRVRKRLPARIEWPPLPFW